MKGTVSALALSALTLVGAADISAQDGTESERGRRGMRRSVNAEAVMSMREHLELTEGQIAQLDVIRAEDVTRRNAMRSELEEVRSQLQAGQIETLEGTVGAEPSDTSFPSPATAGNGT